MRRGCAIRLATAGACSGVELEHRAKSPDAADVQLIFQNRGGLSPVLARADPYGAAKLASAHRKRLLTNAELGVWATEQVAQGFAPEQREPSPPLMLRTVVQQVAPLTESSEVRGRVVAGVVVAVGGRKHDLRHSDSSDLLGGWQAAQSLASSVPPHAGRSVPPAAVTQVNDTMSVWSTATFAAPAGSTEADHDRELRPIDWVEEAVLAPDGHRGSRRCEPMKPDRTDGLGVRLDLSCHSIA